MSEAGHLTGIDECWVHHGLFMFDPDTVTTVWIDPQTGKPIDIDPAPGGEQRAVQRPICTPCMEEINKRRAALHRPPHPTGGTS